jgi:hypothetical protein
MRASIRIKLADIHLDVPVHATQSREPESIAVLEDLAYSDEPRPCERFVWLQIIPHWILAICRVSQHVVCKLERYTRQGIDDEPCRYVADNNRSGVRDKDPIIMLTVPGKVCGSELNDEIKEKEGVHAVLYVDQVAVVYAPSGLIAIQIPTPKLLHHERPVSARET